MEALACQICSFPYRLQSGTRACVDVTQIDEEYFQITWVGDDFESRGADFYGLGSQQRAFDYAESVQKAYLNREIPTGEVLNPNGPRYL